MDGRMDAGRMDIMDGRMDGWIKGWPEQWMDGQNGWPEQWMDERMDITMDGWIICMEGWLEGWT